MPNSSRNPYRDFYNVTRGDTSLSWSCGENGVCANYNGYTYHVVAFLRMDATDAREDGESPRAIRPGGFPTTVIIFRLFYLATTLRVVSSSVFTVMVMVITAFVPSATPSVVTS